MSIAHGTYAVCGGNEKKRNYGTQICGRHFMRMQNELKKFLKKKHLMDVLLNML